MLSKELNLKLIELLPEIRKAYDEEVSWQEGDETGSHTVFGDVFYPYICENANNEDVTKRNFLVIEKILALHDEYADEVITFSVLESLYYDECISNNIVESMGDMAKEIFTKFQE